MVMTVDEGRVARLEERVENLREDVQEIKTQVEAGRKEQREDVRALRSALIGFSLTIAGSAVAASLAVMFSG